MNPHKPIALLATLALALAACTAETGGSPSTGAGCAGGDSTGVTEDEIVLGNTNILSGNIAFIGEDANEGFGVPIKLLNDAGGVFGRTIRLISYDDAYTPAKALEGTKRLIEQDQIFAWAGGIGTPTYLAVVPLLEEANIPAITPFAPARSIGTMEHPLTFMTWANFIVEYETSADYLVENEGMGTTSGDVAFIRFDTEHGEDALQGAKNALAKVDKDVILDIPTTPDQTDYSGVALEVKNSGATWIGVQLSSENGGNLLNAMKEIGYTPQMFTQSDYSDVSFVENFPDVAEGVYGALSTNIFGPPNEKLQQHIADLKAATGSDMTQWRAIGYQQGLLTVEALKRMEAPTRECLIEALQSFDGVDTGIQAPVTFGPDRRMGIDTVGVFQIKDGKVTIIKGFTE